jgi:hypothetical protein
LLFGSITPHGKGGWITAPPSGLDRKRTSGENKRNLFICQNLTYSRYLPLKDVASILAISPDQIDFDQLQEKISAYGLEKEWTEAKSILIK